MNDQRDPETPDRRENAFEAYTSAVERRLHRFFVKALAIFAIIGLTSAVALAGFGIVLSQIKDTRKDFVRETCLAQNQRNDDTVAEFYKVAEELKRQYPNRAAEIDQSVESNLRLINTLAPKQDCEKLSRVSIGEAKPPPPVSTPKEIPPAPQPKETP